MLSFFKKLPLVFYSAPFYKELAKAPKGMGLGFLFFATFLNIAQLIVLFAPAAQEFWAEKDLIFSALPSVKVQDGLFIIDQPPPHAIIFLEKAKEGPLKIVFDTMVPHMGAEAIKKKMADEKILIYVSRDAVSMYDEVQKTLEQRFARNFGDSELTHDDWMRIDQALSYAALPALSFSIFGLLFFSHVLSCLFGALFLFLVAYLFKVQINLKGSFRIAAAAKIPLATLALFLVPPQTVSVLIWFGFALFGLLASKEKKIETIS